MAVSSIQILSPRQAAHLYDRIREAHLTNSRSYRNAIRDFRQVFELLYRLITREEFRSFTSAYQRSVFVMDKYNLDKSWRGQIHGFRRHANKVVHGRQPVSATDYLRSLRAICRQVHFFSGVAIPDTLAAAFAGRKGLGYHTATASPAPVLEAVRVVVAGIGELQERGAQKRMFLLHCEAEEGPGSFRLEVWQNRHLDLVYLHKILWPYATLQLFRIRRKTAGLYTTTLDTLVVLEPDFLVDVTDVAECFQFSDTNPLLYFLGKFTRSTGHEAAFKGKVVNDTLDALIRDPGRDFNGIFREAILENALTLARLGDEKVSRVKVDIERQHLPNLRRIAADLQGREVRIEPTFLSPRFGLQGRLDLLVEYDGNPLRKDIYELKSGKAPEQQALNVWPNNQAQVVGYNLLMLSVFGPGRTGSSAIIYSVSVSDLVRDVISQNREYQQLLRIRNWIVAQVHNLSRHDYTVFEYLAPGKIGRVPSFKEKQVEELAALYRQAATRDRALYRELISFELRELLLNKTGGGGEELTGDAGFATFWLHSQEEKAERFGLIGRLELEAYDPHSNDILFRIAEHREHNFRAGDIAILYALDDHQPDPTRTQIYKGVIRDLSRDRLVFGLKNKQLRQSVFRSATRWFVEHDFYETNYWSVTGSLLDYLRLSAHKRSLLLGEQEPRTATRVEESDLAGLQPDQEKVVRQALAARDYYLIQGPPGTGKTSAVLMAILTNVLAYTKDTVVILAYTNRAVDEIAGKLQKREVDYLRLGGRNSSGSHSVSELAARCSPDRLRQAIGEKRVFLATVAAFSNRKEELAGIVATDLLILDEASQLTESQALPVVARFNRFIMIGDQNQLPAVVVQPASMARYRHEELRALGFRSMGESMFERLYRRAAARGWHHAYGMLSSHFRMHDTIAGLINTYYDGRLQSVLPLQQDDAPLPLYRAADTGLARLLARSRTLFLQSARHLSVKTNREEAIKVAAILATIKAACGHDFQAKTVGVITPWRAQVSLIKNLIDDTELRKQVTVDTIERFQGSERDIIVVSLAVNNEGQLQAIQSLTSDGRVDRKLLVTLSRAREQVILLGYSPVLSASRHYQDMMEKIRDRGGFVGHREGMAVFRPFFAGRD